MGIMDLAAERAEVVKLLNQHRIQVVAWLLLPKEEGYWFNMNNGQQALERYCNFKHWTEQNNLQWKGIGLDLEPDINDLKSIPKNKTVLFWRSYRRLFQSDLIDKSGLYYKKLLQEIESDGYEVESYIINFMYDERHAKTQSLQKLTGILDLPTNKEIPMLYSSYLGENGPGYILEYGKEAEAIAIGITGGGVMIEGIDHGEVLNWEVFSRDLLLASQMAKEVHIFSLEGCVQQGFISRLKDFSFDKKTNAYSNEQQTVKRLRKRISFYLKLLDHPYGLSLSVAFIILLALLLLFRLISRLRS